MMKDIIIVIGFIIFYFYIQNLVLLEYPHAYL